MGMLRFKRTDLKISKDSVLRWMKLLLHVQWEFRVFIVLKIVMTQIE